MPSGCGPQMPSASPIATPPIGDPGKPYGIRLTQFSDNTHCFWQVLDVLRLYIIIYMDLLSFGNRHLFLQISKYICESF